MVPPGVLEPAVVEVPPESVPVEDEPGVPEVAVEVEPVPVRSVLSLAAVGDEEADEPFAPSVLPAVDCGVAGARRCLATTGCGAAAGAAAAGAAAATPAVLGADCDAAPSALTAGDVKAAT